MKLGIRGAIWACARRNTANLSVVDLQLAAWFKSPRMSWTESIIHGCDWSQNVVLGCWSCWCMSYYHAFQKMWVWMHSWVCHGKIIGPAHGTCYQQAHYVLYISCLWCFAFAVIPWLKVHLKLKVFNTHVRVYKVAACWKLRVCVRGKHNQKCIQSRPAKGNQGFLNLSSSANLIISLITVENQLSSCITVFMIWLWSVSTILQWKQCCSVSGPLLESTGDWEAQCFCYCTTTCPHKVVLMLVHLQSACILTFHWGFAEGKALACSCVRNSPIQNWIVVIFCELASWIILRSGCMWTYGMYTSDVLTLELGKILVNQRRLEIWKSRN